MSGFWKTIENLYVKIDDNFSVEDEQAYKEGKLAVDRKDLMGFFWGGVVCVTTIAILEIAVMVMAVKI